MSAATSDRAHGRYGTTSSSAEENRWNGTVAPSSSSGEIFETPERHETLRKWLAGSFARTLRVRDSGAQRSSSNWASRGGRPETTALESDAFRAAVADEPLAVPRSRLDARLKRDPSDVRTSGAAAIRARGALRGRDRRAAGHRDRFALLSATNYAWNGPLLPGAVISYCRVPWVMALARLRNGIKTHQRADR